MKQLIIWLFILLLSSTVSSAQQISYPDWQKETETDVRLLPKFGNLVKNEAQIRADNEFIATVVKEFPTIRKASDYLVQVGFESLAKGEPKTAMYRFNQAWLIDPTNDNAFWGFGGVYFYFRDYDRALQQYTEGLVTNPKSDNILVDMAAIGMARFNQSKDQADLNSPLSLLKRAYEINPTNQNLLSKLSICYFLKNDCAHARKYYDECKKLGGKTLTESYGSALEAKCKI